MSKAPDLSESEALDRFINSLDDLDEAQLMSLRAAWRGADLKAREDAWAAVRALASKHSLTGDVDRVRDRAMDWASKGTNVPIPYAIDMEQTRMQLRREAAPAVVDAALAIALDERLDEATRDVLLGPWLRTITRP